MVSGRPLLYLSLPSLAILIGLVWFRRKKSIGFDSGGKKDVEELGSIDKSNAEANGKLEMDITGTDLKQTESLPISSPSISGKGESGKNQSSSSSSSCSGKSAPIDIVSNTRSPPKISDQQLDAELLKLKIQESDIRNLRLIEEQDDYSSFESPVNLPGTVERYQNFNKFNKSLEPQVEPVVVKATMVAKVSPTNSFATELTPPRDREIRHKNSKITSSQQDMANNNLTLDHSEQNGILDKMHVITKDDTINNNNDEGQQNGHTAVDENKEHSPAVSPPLSVCSMHSGDSGKGSSPPHSEYAPATSYDFLLPVYLVAKILGRNGRFVQKIKNKSGANVLIKRNPETHETKICTLEGTQAEIDKALALIRRKFPEKRFKSLTLQQVQVGNIENVFPLPIIDTTYVHLQLVEGINNDVAVSAIVDGGHVFLQQPLHPSFQSLNAMQHCLNQSYNMLETPQLLNVFENAICVGCIQGVWYRIQIVSHQPTEQYCVIKLLDFGGYETVSTASLRQIRTDFMTVPFQAIECVLSNVRPVGENGWSPEAKSVICRLSHGKILQAQVAGHTAEGLPEIYLFTSLARDNIVFINQELAALNLAIWED
ncbi:A-kinase anchor protein 1, mitochondrial [Uranotaenia lowii]|uniref:A-kinase anchor protein 1, mitochondrial n=1 Tax=Uranotaenia lowii TaxID=190385 RepID=UPI00247838CA|nr:A-kinase anchor protein 1, mitochondrial [Uranotaenia lowii]XP_055585927.1 A-kinase anchor protein 1, mitochondrial [Uranotaenia lowii]